MGSPQLVNTTSFPRLPTSKIPSSLASRLEADGGEGLPNPAQTPGPLPTAGRSFLEAFQLEISVQSFSWGGETAGGAALRLIKR